MTNTTSTRRDFLTALGATTATVALTGCVGSPAHVPVPAPAPASPWDDSWTRRLGKHRTLFDVAEMEAIPGVGQIPPVMDAYHEVLGVGDDALGFVLVIRHFAVPLFFGDALWQKYEVGTTLKRHDPKTSAPYVYNPMRPLIEMVQKRGVVVLGCSTAVLGFAASYAQKTKADADSVRREVLAGVMPGVILQPNGLYALARAQDVGCGFMR